MKKLLFSFFLGIFAQLVSAQSPKVCAKTFNKLGNEITVCNPTDLGFLPPCGSALFIVTEYLPAPTGYDHVGKSEWYVNDVLVKTQNDAGQPFLDWPIQSQTTNVYCKVSYVKLDGISFSSQYKSTTFTPFVKQLDFPFNISTTTPAPNYNCSSAIVNYSILETPCDGDFCGGTDNVLGNYSITWEAPAGWVQTSLTNKGSNVSFSADANSTGMVIATIHKNGCTYTETRTLNVTRGTEAPTFTSSTVTGCSGSSSVLSINPVCGASNYTYRIIGNPGITFASNGLQTLTTPSTSVSISSSGGASSNSIKAKSNFPNSISSEESSLTFSVYSGLPSMGGTYFSNNQEHPLHFYLGNPSDNNSVCNYARDSVNMLVNNATSVTWTKLSSNPAQVTYSQYGNNLTFYLWSINQTALFEIQANNGCGSLTNDFGFKSINCSGSGGGGGGGGCGCPQFLITPNPAQGTLYVVVPNIPAPCDPPPLPSLSSNSSSVANKHSITQIKIYDSEGNLKKIQNINKAKQASVNLFGIKTGVYLVEISDGTYKESKQIIIQ